MTLWLGGGKSFQEHGKKGCIWILLGRGGDNVVYLFGVPGGRVEITWWNLVVSELMPAKEN
jgi:hypothetical protein